MTGTEQTKQIENEELQEIVKTAKLDRPVTTQLHQTEKFEEDEDFYSGLGASTRAP